MWLASSSTRRALSAWLCLIDTHRDLSIEQSQALNARLVLLLANYIGDCEVLKQALLADRKSVV